MKITDLLKDDKLTISFEVFPPKTESNYDSVKHATEEIARLRPSFMSVTYGAGGVCSAFVGIFIALLCRLDGYFPVACGSFRGHCQQPYHGKAFAPIFNLVMSVLAFEQQFQNVSRSL